MSVALPPVVDATWAVERAGDVVFADVRWSLTGPPGRAAYEAGHVPGAVFVDLDRDLAGPSGGTAGRHPLPAPHDFAAALGGLGIADDDVVVAYDDAGGSVAARLVWMLRVLGFPAALLDGGLPAWPGPLEVGAVQRRPVGRAVRPWPADRLATADDVVAGTARGAVVLDARPPERFRGDVEPVDARPGHVPGSRNAPWANALDPATGRFLSPDELRARFAALGAAGDADVIASCGSGVTACHVLLAMERAGLHGRLFPASWSGWAADASRPAALGDA